jgi:O-antigen/teichoic acid export membrane protein
VAALRAMLGQVLVRRTVLVSLALVVGGAFWALVVDAGGSPLGFAVVALLLALDVARLFESTLLNATRRQGVFSAWAFVNEAGRPALAVAAIFLFGPEAANVLLGYAVAVAIGNLAFRRASVRGDDAPVRTDDDWAREARRSALSFAAPFVPVAAINWVFTFSDRYLLAGLSSAEAAGIYVAGYGIASMPFMLWGSLLSLTLRPVYFDAVARGDRRRERRIFALWFGVLVPPMVFAVAVATWLREPIVRLLLGESFWGAAELLPWIAAAYALQSTAQLFDHAIQAQRRTHVMPWMHGGAAVTALALYLWLIPELGAMGGAIGTVCGMAVMLVLSIALSAAGLRSATPGG